MAAEQNSASFDIGRLVVVFGTANQTDIKIAIGESVLALDNLGIWRAAHILDSGKNWHPESGAQVNAYKVHYFNWNKRLTVGNEL